MYAYATQPQSIDDDTFNDIENIETAVLHVPEGTATLYAGAAGWRRFTIITEDVTNGIGTAGTVNGVRVSRVDGGYMVDGTRAGDRYAVYTVAGSCLSAGTARGTSLFVPSSNAAQPLILRIGGKAVKLW